MKKSASPGYWITIHGHPVLIKGVPLTAQHAGDIADAEGLSPAGKQAVLAAHAAGKLHSDKQVHGMCADISGAVQVGLDESHAISEALKSHGVTPKSVAVAAGASTKTKIGDAVATTHGHDVQPGEATAYGQQFGLDKDATALLEKKVQAKSTPTSDTKLVQAVANILHVAGETGKTHLEAATLLDTGHNPTEIIEAHNAALITAQAPPISSQAPSVSSPHSVVGGGTPPLVSLGTKTKADFAAIPDVHLPHEGPMPPLKPGQTRSAGIIIIEPDGKMWIYEPKDHFAGYEHTFSKGGVESGLSLQQSAHKELYEELGLSANITGVLGDFDTPGTSTRYYIGVRSGGDPKDAESGLTQPGAVETEKVKLVTPEDAAKLLNKKRDQEVLNALAAHIAASGNPHAPAVAASPPVAPQAAPALDLSDHAHLKTHVEGQGLKAMKSASVMLQGALAAGTIAPDQVPGVVAQATDAVKMLGNKQVEGKHVAAAIATLGHPVSATVNEIKLNNYGAAAAKTQAKSKGAGVAPPPVDVVTPDSHHVTLKGVKFDVDHLAPVSAADVDSLHGQVPVSANGQTKLKAMIASGEIKTHGQLMEKAAMAQAASLASNHNSVNGMGLGLTSSYPSVESMLDAAHNGDASAVNYVAKLGGHSFSSPAAAKSAQNAADAAKVAQAKVKADASFAVAAPADHLHTKIEDGAIGYNSGATYALPDGTKNYVKDASNPAVAHNEQLANEIYKALGHSAPNSKVFDAGGQTKYASQIIENAGHLGQHGITPEVSKSILQGFAADALLGNHDVLGNGKTPLSNVVVGHDGAPHRIDNGGSLLFTGTGGAKTDVHKAELREWDGFASSGTNGNYAKVFAAAGVKDASSIAGIGQQIKAISALRDSHGGWENFIKSASPQMPESQRRETAALLEHRTKLLEEKAKTVAGANSLVGTRKFEYDSSTGYSHGDAHEQKLIGHHTKNAPELSDDEKAAVSSFKTNDYGKWNDSLLGNKPLSPENLKKTAALDAMFQKPGMTLGHDSALSRAINVSSAELAKIGALTPGAIIAHTPVFQSTSTNSAAWTGRNLHFCILTPKEMPAVTPRAYTSANASENEVLLPRGVSYRIVSVSGPNDPPPPGAPANWKWNSGATRVVVEAIVPDAQNTMEHDGVATHMIEHDSLVNNAANLAAHHAKAPLPNISGLPASTVPAWNAGTAKMKVAAPKKKAAKKSALPSNFI